MTKPTPLSAEESEAALAELQSLLRFGLVCAEQLEENEYAAYRNDMTALLYMALDKTVTASRAPCGHGEGGPGMIPLRNFAFEDHLVRVVTRDGEPWFAGKDVCGALGIKDHHQALEKLDPDERGGYSVPTPMGEQSMIVISEPGVYRLVFRSSKPEAERFKRWLAHDVLPAIRKTGHYSREEPMLLEPLPTDRRQALLEVREARLIFGVRAARALWRGSPHLPAVADLPFAPAEGTESGRHCLSAILTFEDRRGETVRDLLAQAEGKGEVWRRLRDLGLFIEPARTGLRARTGLPARTDLRAQTSSRGSDGIAVAINPRRVERLFSGTRWESGRHVPALRGLAGTTSTRKICFSGNIVSAAIFIPLAAQELPESPGDAGGQAAIRRSGPDLPERPATGARP